MSRYFFVVLFTVLGCSQNSESLGNPFARGSSSALCDEGESSCEDGNVYRCIGESWELEVACSSQNLLCALDSGVARCVASAPEEPGLRPGDGSSTPEDEQDETENPQCIDGQSRCVSDSIESCSAGVWGLIADCRALEQRCSENDSGAFCQTADGPEVPVSGLCEMRAEFWNEPHRNVVFRYSVLHPQDGDTSPTTYAERKDASTFGLISRAWLDYDSEDRLIAIVIDDNGDGNADRSESWHYDAEGRVEEIKQFIGETQVGRFWVEQDGTTQITRYDEGLDGDLEYFEERQYNEAGQILRLTIDGTLSEDDSLPPLQSLSAVPADGVFVTQNYLYDTEGRLIERRWDRDDDEVDDFLNTTEYIEYGTVEYIDDGADGVVEQKSTVQDGPFEASLRVEAFAPETTSAVLVYEYVERRDVDGGVYEQELRSQPEFFSSNYPAVLFNRITELPGGGTRVDGYNGSWPTAAQDQLVQAYEEARLIEGERLTLEVDGDFDGVSDLRVIEDANEAGLLTFQEIDGVFEVGPTFTGINFGLRYEILEEMDGQWNERFSHDFSCLSF